MLRSDSDDGCHEVSICRGLQLLLDQIQWIYQSLPNAADGTFVPLTEAK